MNRTTTNIRRYSIEKPRSIPQQQHVSIDNEEKRIRWIDERSTSKRKYRLELPKETIRPSKIEIIKFEEIPPKKEKKKSNLNKKERRNVLIYIVGIMFYKFGLESFNGSIVSLATNRYDRDAFQSGSNAKTFEKIGLLIGLNQLFQCFGSIVSSPLMKSSSIRFLLFISIFLFALFSSILLIIDAATGGRIRPSNLSPEEENQFNYYGNYPTNLLIPIYCLTGFVFGIVELIRRIIPQNIVGTNEEKLQRMDSLVHLFYEIAGVSGALLTGLVLIPRLGNNYSFLITPICFTCSALIWFSLRLKEKKTKKIKEKKKKIFNFGKNVLNYFRSFIFGGKLIFTHRKFVWLYPCFTLTLYIHKYIENGLAPQIAQRYLNKSQWSQIIVGGSNSGELIGALIIFFFNRFIRSPMICLRIDSILLLISWILPFYSPQTPRMIDAWIFAFIYISFGFGSSIDEISLNVYLQSTLPESDRKNPHLSPLGSVMSFLYSSYIILYAILNPLLGKYIDKVYSAEGTIRPALLFTSSVQISIVSLIVFLSTFIPKGSFKFNPRLHR